MNIEKTQENGKTTFALEGRLDTTTAPRLEEALMPALDQKASVTLDFSKLDYVSSAGLRVLLAGQKKANSNNATLTLAGVSEDITEVFDMTGFTDILTIK